MSQAWDIEIVILVLIFGVAWYFYNRRINADKAEHSRRRKPESALEFFREFEHAEGNAEDGSGARPHRDSTTPESGSPHFRHDEHVARPERENGLDAAPIESVEQAQGDPTRSRQAPPAHEEPGPDDRGRLGAEVAESVEFVFDSHRFAISERRWRGRDGETHAEFSFFEDGSEVFAIRCLVSVDANGVRYEGCKVATFDTSGNWAKALLGFYATKPFEGDRTSSMFTHLRAEGVEHRLS